MIFYCILIFVYISENRILRWTVDSEDRSPVHCVRLANVQLGLNGCSYVCRDIENMGNFCSEDNLLVFVPVWLSV